MRFSVVISFLVVGLAIGCSDDDSGEENGSSNDTNGRDTGDAGDVERPPDGDRDASEDATDGGKSAFEDFSIGGCLDDDPDGQQLLVYGDSDSPPGCSWVELEADGDPSDDIETTGGWEPVGSFVHPSECSNALFAPDGSGALEEEGAIDVEVDSSDEPQSVSIDVWLRFEEDGYNPYDEPVRLAEEDVAVEDECGSSGGDG